MSYSGIFRKSALEKLSTPEKLDQLIKITSPRAWIALLAIAIMISTALAWGFWGRVKTKINTTGVLLGGEVHDIFSTSQGQLVKLNVAVGEVIKEGDIIAEIDQPELAQQIEDARAALIERQYELKQLMAFGSKDTEIQDELIQQQRASVEQQISSVKKNIIFLKQQLEIDKELFAKGLATKPQVIGSEQNLENAENQIVDLRARLVEMSSQELTAGFNLDNKITVVKQRIAQEERRVNQLEEQHNVKKSIKSPHSGEVVEVLSSSGTVVGPGTALFKVKNELEISESEEIRGVLYVSSQDGKKIKVGMEALVVPATVKPQEFGFMKAKVVYVSEFPVTQQGMMTSMKNDQLVQSLLSMGAPYKVEVEFEPNSESYSGYEWTSANGPEILVNAGTSCMGRITVKEEPPIAMVIPALKKFFDLY